ncbi:81a4f605-ebb0-461f-b832-b025b5f90e9b [Sclerotinia trifoliorum]|uniref:81a4f605-ebb0-461f-b832-b025b5f90e9b n=1 Tax=Sclerotinia trifoliorum TaxID=28548 RepID=A0A8H2W5V7_9HELO|nr:81a4f605-ebb0-461f-b832-b025b5f90e9b [Sclerotinia trifoliorum]
MRAMEMDRNNPLSTLEITNLQPTNPPTLHFKMKTESNLFLPFPIAPSESSRLPTPSLMDSPTSPNTPTFSNTGVISINSSISSPANLNNRMMGTSLFGPPLYKQMENKESMEAGRRDDMRYCFDPSNQIMGGFNNIHGTVEDRGSVIFKREESFVGAPYESFMK